MWFPLMPRPIVVRLFFPIESNIIIGAVSLVLLPQFLCCAAAAAAAAAFAVAGRVRFFVFSLFTT